MYLNRAHNNVRSLDNIPSIYALDQQYVILGGQDVQKCEQLRRAAKAIGTEET